MSNMSAKPRTNFPRDDHWSPHRSIWSRPDCKNDKNEVALSRHYTAFHGIVNKPPMHKAYPITFAEQPNFHSLNICESKYVINLMHK